MELTLKHVRGWLYFVLLVRSGRYCTRTRRELIQAKP
jgi:hypothetical protein